MRRAWMLHLPAVLLCHTLTSCSSPTKQDAKSQSATAAAAAAAGARSTAPSSAADSGTAPLASDCAAKFCVAAPRKLSDYCNEENARCPADGEAAKALACQNRFARQRLAFLSSCGGNSVRILYDYGALDYHYDSAGSLRAVTTIANGGSETCEADIVMYGDASCQAGAVVELTCP